MPARDAYATMGHPNQALRMPEHAPLEWPLYWARRTPESGLLCPLSLRAFHILDEEGRGEPKAWLHDGATHQPVDEAFLCGFHHTWVPQRPEHLDAILSDLNPVAQWWTVAVLPTEGVDAVAWSYAWNAIRAHPEAFDQERKDVVACGLVEHWAAMQEGLQHHHGPHAEMDATRLDGLRQTVQSWCLDLNALSDADVEARRAWLMAHPAAWQDGGMPGVAQWLSLAQALEAVPPQPAPRRPRL